MGLIEKNQEYAYNAQEKLRNTQEDYDKKIDLLKHDFTSRIVMLENENDKLKNLLDKVHVSEEDKGNEVKMVRANLIEEIFRVQNIHQKNEDDLRRDNDIISIKYSEGINSFKEALKKADEDNNMLRSKLTDIIAENKQTEADLIFQINELNRTNNKLVKTLEDKHKEFLNKSKTETTRRSDHYSSFDKEDIENIDSSIGQVIASSNKTVEVLERTLKEKSIKFKKEKDKLYDEIESRENIYAEKLALRDMELERTKSTYERQRKLEETKAQTLAKENRILDKVLRGKYS